MDFAKADAVAAWWRTHLQNIKMGLTPGGQGWNDVQAKLTVLRLYDNARSAVEHRASVAPRLTQIQDDTAVETLAEVVRRLAFALHCDQPDLDGWRDSWRPDGG